MEYLVHMVDYMDVYVCIFFKKFETGFLYVILAVLELAMETIQHRPL